MHKKYVNQNNSYNRPILPLQLKFAFEFVSNAILWAVKLHVFSMVFFFYGIILL